MSQNPNARKNAHIWIGGTLAALLVGSAIAFAGSQNGLTVAGLPLFAVCAGFAFVIQWLVFIPAYVYQTERYFDLMGSLTYISVTLLTLAVVGFDDIRTVFIGILVLIWASRLGTFLFKRVSDAGEDRRFRSMKTDPLQFFMTWTLQGLWVTVTYAAGLAAMTAAVKVDADVFFAVGVLMWFAGFAIEVIADGQKSAFRADESNRNSFIQSGLWAWSRHPNYFGEIVLWLGITVMAIPVLQGWQFLCLISPVFVVVLLTKISGVRMLEHRANKQWGEDPEYQAYKASTPVLVLRPPKARPVAA